MLERFGYALGGALLGGIITYSLLSYFGDSINWTHVEIAAGICAVLSFLIGKDIVLLLADICWWS
jgi:hypothetical protein